MFTIAKERHEANSFYIFHVTCSEIEAEISRLKTGKSVGPFSIPIDILKMLKAYVSKPLEIVFNASFSTGVVLSDFKIKNKVLIENQYGFRTKHSTDHAILCIIDKIQKAIDDRRYSKF